MTIEVILDSPVDQCRTQQTVRGYTAMRPVRVLGLDGDAPARQYQALTHPQVPKLGDAHPVVPKIVCLDRNVSANDPAQVTILCSYSIPTMEDIGMLTDGIISIEIDGQTINEQTSQDSIGDLLKVSYSGTGGAAAGLPGVLINIEDIIDATIYRPQTQIRITRDYDALPKAAILKYEGRVNADVWSGLPPRTVLCSNVRATPYLGRFRTVYEFLYKPTGWQLLHVMRINGWLVPSDAQEGNGIFHIDVHPTIPFAGIGVSW